MPFGRPRDGRRDARRSALCRAAPAHLAAAAFDASRAMPAHPGRSRDHGRTRPGRWPSAERALTDDKARAERRRRARGTRRAAHQSRDPPGVASRSFSLLWEIGGADIDPVLFTTPSAVAVAAVEMIRSGELWTYLWPSLVVLLYRLHARGRVRDRHRASAGALLGARRGAQRLHHLPLFDPIGRAGAADRAVGGLSSTTAKVIILFLFAFFPMVINTYQGVKAVDPKLIEVGRAFRCNESASSGRTSCMPAPLPFIVTGLAARARARPDRHGAGRPLHRRSPASAI